MLGKKKKKRTIQFQPPKKSRLLSTISIKHKPKRKIKNLLRKFVFYLFLFFSSFGLSILILYVCFSPRHTVLNPLQNTFIHVLGSSTQKSPNEITAEVKKQLEKHNLSFSSVSVNGSDVSIQLSDGMEALLSTDKDISSQIDSLQVTTDNLTIEGKRILRVDTRFSRPVVTFQ